MGTDITLFAERKNANDTWELIDNPVQTDGLDALELMPYELDLPRNYYLFAMLAGVRNGMRTVEDYIPISLPRGIPENISDIGRSYHNWFEDDAHDASWLLKSEVLDFDGSRIMQHQAMVDRRVAYLFNENPLGFPNDQWPKEVPVSTSVYHKNGASVKWRSTYEDDGLAAFRTQINDYRDDDRFVFWFSS